MPHLKWEIINFAISWQSNQEMKMNEITDIDKEFVSEIRQIINTARSNAMRSVDFCRVQMYWNIGKRIFEK